MDEDRRAVMVSVQYAPRKGTYDWRARTFIGSTLVDESRCLTRREALQEGIVAVESQAAQTELVR